MGIPVLESTFKYKVAKGESMRLVQRLEDKYMMSSTLETHVILHNNRSVGRLFVTCIQAWVGSHQGHDDHLNGACLISGYYDD